jgi:hypothetical protein
MNFIFLYRQVDAIPAKPGQFPGDAETPLTERRLVQGGLLEGLAGRAGNARLFDG